MRISVFVNILLLLVILTYVIMLVSVNWAAPQTLQLVIILSALVVVAIIFAIQGRAIISYILSKLGARVTIGRLVITEKYGFIYDSDTAEPVIVGFSVVKLIPAVPTVDLDEDAKKYLLRNMEALVSMPSDFEYGFIKISSPDVQKILQRVTMQHSIMLARASRSKNPMAYKGKIEVLEKDIQRLTKSPPAKSLIYVKVYAYGYSEADVKSKLDSYINQIKGIAQSLQMEARELSHGELLDFLFLQAVGGALSL